ncbi:hypothetical protein [Gordonia sp. 'Campus']|uniref:hypothetical protein n=1 Tax=Gordonia sp. 'Campus' TaxID=2915824 RepID=UPI001EE3FA33|nr:hypothetical protein [Gordonia sp. 'Campus']
MTTSALAAARELTGFDAGRVGTGSGVLVLGTEGVGVRTLAGACGALAPELDVAARTDPAVPPGVALVVVDPSSSVGEEERLLVDRARAQVGTVALVCTKIDAFWEWPRIVRGHRKTLDPFATLPMFGVSAAAALGGAVDESGVDALVEWVRDAVRAPVEVRLERARVAAGLGALERLVGAEAPAPERTVDDMLAERRALLVARDRGRVDRLAAVRAGLVRARSESSAELHAGVRSLAAAAVEDGPVTGAEYGARLREGWGGLAATIQRGADERVDEVRATALVGLDAEATPADPWSEIPLDTGRPGRRPRRGGAEDALLVIIGASTGLGVGRLVVAPMASVQTLQWFSMPLTLLLGVAVAGWIIRVRRGALDRAERTTRTTELLADARSALDHQLGLRIAAAETRISGQIARAYERRVREVAQRVAALDDEIRHLRSGDASRADRTLRERAAAVRTDLAGRSGQLWAEPHAPEPDPDEPHAPDMHPDREQ